MWLKTAFLSLTLSLFLSTSLQADTGNLSVVIEQFVVAQFPTSKTHFWVINDTHWQTDNEVVLDVNTVVLSKYGETPTANRYLLLIVDNKLAASQNIPLDTTVDCQPEQT